MMMLLKSIFCNNYAIYPIFRSAACILSGRLPLGLSGHALSEHMTLHTPNLILKGDMSPRTLPIYTEIILKPGLI